MARYNGYGYGQNYANMFFTPTYNEAAVPIDLKELATSYDTLQQRHDLAIQTASAYKQALAKLDLNEAESAFLDQQVNKLDSAIAENTNYNNAGFALNDIISEYGDIMSNQGLLGRLDAQKQYKAFQTTVDSNDTLSADTKQYLKENNPYSYVPEFDAQGRELRGKAWTPTINPVNTISHAEIVAQAVQMAAKDSGKGNQVRFLDANGNVTTDPQKAVDGEIYNNTTTSWERLSEDKIRAALQTILSDSAVAESLDQDYRVALWKKAKDGSNPLVEDANGVTLDKSQYIEQSLKGGIKAALYNNVQTTVDYSNLAEARKSFAANYGKASSGDSPKMFSIDGSLIGYTQPIDIEYKLGAELANAKTNASSALVSLLGSNLTGENLMNFIAEIDSADDTKLDEIFNRVLATIPDQNKEAFTNSYRKAKRDFINAKINYESQFEGLDEDKRNVADFVARTESGNGFIKGKSKYDDDIIQIVDNIFGETGEYIDLVVSSDKNYNNLRYLLGDEFEHGTNEEGKHYYRLNKKDYNKIGKFAKGINITDERTYWSSILPIEPVNVVVYDKNKNPLGGNQQSVGSSITGFVPVQNNISNKDRLQGILNIISNANKDVSNIYSGIVTIPSSNVNTGRYSGKDYIAYNQYQNGFIKIDDYDKIVDKDIVPEMNRILSSFDPAQGKMWIVDENGTKLKEVTSAAERQEYGNNLRLAYNHKADNVVPSVVDNEGTGPALMFAYPVYNGKDKVTEERQYFITTAIKDPVLDEIRNSSQYQNNRLLTQLGFTKVNHTLLNDNDIAGFAANSLQAIDNNTFEYKIGGETVNVLTKADANKLMQKINYYLTLRDNITSTDISAMTQADAAALTNTLADVAQSISTATRGLYPPMQILQILYNDMK